METKEILEQIIKMDNDLIDLKSSYKKILDRFKNDIRIKQKKRDKALRTWFKKENPIKGKKNINHYNDIMKAFHKEIKKESTDNLISYT